MDIKAASKIYILESPSQRDVADGRKEGGALNEILRLAEIKSDYHQVSDEKELIQAFDVIAQDINKNKEGNIWIAIHFSMHGNGHGVGLTSGEFIEWKKFAIIWMRCFTDKVGYFTNPANGQRFCPVYMCFSACEGLGAMEMKNYSSSSPYFVLVAPNMAINWSDSLMAFAILYHTLLHKKSGIDKAIERMNLVNELEKVFQFDIIQGWGVI